ncbi:MAG TPA: MCE family protein [Jatrophihabitans sp.]|jgi:phospholipid/cholesterol/gamma-HCH transport system substrate-binding protein|uniref:MCE family protein n=1 Tax=Jatrophihabitans sp. TaxID=1932789 RepID=UPI002E05EAAE|nr:MCE family protein [Jatrophihabitans sp.]
MKSIWPPLIKLLVFLTITAFFTYVLAATISNQAFGSTNSYKADFTDVTGLQQGDDVRIAGVRVGTIDGIAIHKRTNDTSIAQVTFTVQKSRTLPRSVVAKLRYRNLVGQRYLDVEPVAGGSNAILAPGGTIPLSQTRPAVDLTVLFQGFQPLVQGLDATQINTLSLEVIKTLQGEGGSLELLLTNLADLTNSLADKDQVIGSVVDNLSAVLKAVGDRDTELSNLIIQLKNFVSGLAADRTTIGNAIDGINNLATSTAGLLTQVRAPLAQDVKDLTGLVATLNRNSSTVKFVVQQIPPTVAGLIRTAQYGSWFNFYLCSLEGSLILPGGKVLDLTALPKSSQPRCN